MYFIHKLEKHIKNLFDLRVNEEHLVPLDSEEKQDFQAQEGNQDLPAQEDPMEFQVLQEKTV